LKNKTALTHEEIYARDIKVVGTNPKHLLEASHECRLVVVGHTYDRLKDTNGQR
jgi:hypothetical protein